MCICYAYSLEPVCTILFRNTQWEGDVVRTSSPRLQRDLRVSGLIRIWSFSSEKVYLFEDLPLGPYEAYNIYLPSYQSHYIKVPWPFFQRLYTPSDISQNLIALTLPSHQTSSLAANWPQTYLSMFTAGGDHVCSWSMLTWCRAEGTNSQQLSGHPQSWWSWRSHSTMFIHTLDQIHCTNDKNIQYVIVEHSSIRSDRAFNIIPAISWQGLDSHIAPIGELNQAFWFPWLIVPQTDWQD